MPVPWFALVLALAAPAAAAASAPTSKLELAVTAADTTLRAAKLGPRTFDYNGAIARTAGLDPDLLAAQLDALTSACPGPGPCAPLQPHTDLVDRLARALGRLGGDRHAGSLLRASRRGSFAASQALDDLRTRAMVEALPRARCDPPSPAELGRAAAGLAGFLVVRVRAGVLTAEPLQPRERDDLAYFLAALGDAGREVGAPAEASTSIPGQPGKPGAQDQLRTDALAQLQLATHAGDLAGAIAAGRRYLASFGYPGALDGAIDPDQAWGGARHSFVMRDLAELAELTGELTLAYDLNRRADPGGGMCGTSYWSFWKTQVGGLIRSAERLGDCRPVIAERLLDIDGEDSSDASAPDPKGLGTGRLAAAGFDVPRLYRGAMLTLGRDDEPALRRALEAAPAPLRTHALARLAHRGREDWARRVYAIEGLAATGDLKTLTTLAGMLDSLTPADQARVARTIGEAAQRPPFDPCGPDQTFGGGGGSNMWTREVPMLGRRCETSLTVAQSNTLASALLPLVEHREEQVQSAAIEALGKLAVQSTRPTLRKLARPRPPACADDRTCAAQRRHQAAVEAVATLDRAPTDPVWRKYDGKRGQ
ncbi:MAG TPA: hypothetical protein VGB85_12765 [Nannocystis sp.]|jgi:hypothetical protein